MLSSGLQSKLAHMERRLEELNLQMSSTTVLSTPSLNRTLGKEQAELRPVVECYQHYRKNAEELEAARELSHSADPELRSLAVDEIRVTEQRGTEMEQRLRSLLLPSDPNDNRNVFLELRAGTGGDEAALFVGVLMRMYMRYAEARRWQSSCISAHSTSLHGFRELILRISGKGVYQALKFESGVHRVQRVPETESQGRVHTSACTVAVLPEVEVIDTVALNPAELRVDTFRASGAGGQHINKTDSAVRITHLPTGVAVECQAERSQHQNRARAMALLQARLAAVQIEQQRKERDATRRLQVGSGDRSQRIRTYNFPQGRVTDHRISMTLYKLDSILLGELDMLLEPLAREHQAELLVTARESA